MEKILEVKDLTKSYKENMVLNKLSFDVYKGEILGFLGPNGAGKSTTINIITGALRKNSGSVLFNGVNIEKNIKKYKGVLGVVPQDIALYENLSAKENIRFFASLYGLKKDKLRQAVDYALEVAELSERANDKVKTFSGGMKRRLNIACAIAHKPLLVVMDEPTVGIDPQSRNHILQTIKKLNSEGMTIIYTTHYMEEVEEISSRIIIIDKGHILRCGSKEELKKGISNENIYEIETKEEVNSSLSGLYSIEGILEVNIEKNNIKIKSIRNIDNIDYIFSYLIKNNVKIVNIKLEEPSLETVFLNLTGKKLRD